MISVIEGCFAYEKEVITFEALRSQTRPRKPLRKICVTNDYRYVPFVVIIIQAFLHLKLITGFVTRATRQVAHGDQELLTISKHLRSPPCFSEVRVIDLWFFLYCFVDHCLYFTFRNCIVCLSSIYSFWLPLLVSLHFSCNLLEVKDDA
jgi:hypothetical protein